MATDGDAPDRRLEDEFETDSFEGLKAAEDKAAPIDDDGEIVESFTPPAHDLSGEELTVTVVPRGKDEFTCSSCYLVQSTRRIDHIEPDGSAICQDCA